MLLCWGRGQASCIHDHAGSHCFMKILDGELMESLFPYPEGEAESAAGAEALVPCRELTVAKDDILYINGEIVVRSQPPPRPPPPPPNRYMVKPSVLHCLLIATWLKVRRASSAMIRPPHLP